MSKIQPQDITLLVLGAALGLFCSLPLSSPNSRNQLLYTGIAIALLGWGLVCYFIGHQTRFLGHPARPRLWLIPLVLSFLAALFVVAYFARVLH